MTITEMHIAINQGLQKINSFQVDIFLPQEIDLEINKNIERFVAQRYSKLSNIKRQGFEESQKRIDDLRTLVVEYSSKTTYKGQIGPIHHIDSFALPTPGSTLGNEDYLHLLNVRALIEHEGCKPVKWTQEVISQDCSCSVVVPGSTPAILEANCAGLVPPGVWSCTSTYEDYRVVGSYQADSAGNLVTDANGDYILITDKSTAVSGCKYCQHDDIFELLKDPFNTTKYTKPLYTIIDNNLDMYTDNTFVVNSAKITYLKYPNVVDVLAGDDCDLPLYTHQEIVDMTINSLLEAISDPRYQTQSVEVLKSE
jgi:hypothetical protein